MNEKYIEAIKKSLEQIGKEKLNKDKIKRSNKITVAELWKTLETIREREEEIEEAEKQKKTAGELSEEERQTREASEKENGSMKIKGKQVFLEETKIDDRKFEEELKEMSERKKEAEYK